jgi:hypothetical protein
VSSREEMTAEYFTARKQKYEGRPLLESNSSKLLTLPYYHG